MVAQRSATDSSSEILGMTNNRIIDEIRKRNELFAREVLSRDSTELEQDIMVCDFRNESPKPRSEGFFPLVALFVLVA